MAEEQEQHELLAYESDEENKEENSKEFKGGLG